jgi:basic membrane protein A
LSFRINGSSYPSAELIRDFEAGVNYYNTIHAASVGVKGGRSELGGGLKMENFDSLEDGRAYTEDLLLAGVDVVMPEAGPAGLGSAAVCMEAGQCLIIGIEKEWLFQTRSSAQ